MKYIISVGIETNTELSAKKSINIFDAFFAEITKKLKDDYIGFDNPKVEEAEGG